jgi:small subunit ribosomal protein S9
MEITHTIGRRKTAIARIYLQPGSGDIKINNRNYKEYFTTLPLQYIINQALEISNVKDTYDIKVNVEGGGITGQAEAIRLAITRALCKINPEHKPALKSNGLLTRDPRMVERKRFQFSKR